MGSGSSKQMAPVATRTIETQTDVSNLEDVSSQQSLPGMGFFQARITHGSGTRTLPPTATVTPVTANGQQKPAAGHDGNQQGDLPAPKPPSTSKDQLIANQNYQEMDERARKAGASEANSFDGLNQYLMEGKKETVVEEIMPETVQNEETVATVQDGPQNGAVGLGGTSQGQSEANGETGEVEEPQNTTETSTTHQDSVTATTAETLQEDVERQIEEAKATQAKIDMQQQMSKKRQQLSLQEKLEARKRKRQENVQRQEEKRARAELEEKQGTVDLGQQSQVTDVKETRGQTEGKTVRFADEPGTAVNVGEQQQDVIIPSASEEPVLKGVDRHAEIKKAEEAAPLMPKMPVTKKESVYRKEDISLFKDLEDHAVSLALVKPKTTDTFATLMEVLLIHDLSDLEKVRMIFHWVTAQNLNEMTFGDDVEDDSPAGYLKAIKEERQTYATLFERLCSAAGLHSKTVHGYMKGVRYNPDHHFEGPGDRHRGTWNAVLVDGEWRLIDCHWGSRHVTGDDQVSVDQLTTVYKYEEFYFLTDPEQLIDTHFPDQPEWQLLDKPLSLADFEAGVKCWPLFYKLHASLVSHKSGMVHTENGTAEIRVGFQKEDFTKVRFSYRLKTKDRNNTVDGVDLNRYVLQETREDHESFTVQIPIEGRYLIEIYGGEDTGDKEQTETSNVCLYMIVCESAKQNCTIFPECPIARGPGRDVVKAGMTPLSHKEAVIKTETGRVELKFRKPGDLDFRQNLYKVKSEETEFVGFAVNVLKGDEVTFHVRTPKKGTYGLIIYSKDGTEEENKFSQLCYFVIVCEKDPEGIVPFPKAANQQFGPAEPQFSELGLVQSENADYHLQTDNGEVNIGLKYTNDNLVFKHILSSRAEEGKEGLDQYVFRQTVDSNVSMLFRPPHAGEYSLALYAGTGAELKNVVNYFLTCDKPRENVQPFPPIGDAGWGPVLPPFSDIGLSLEAPKTAYITGENGEATINLGLSKPVGLRFRMSLHKDSTSESMDQYIFYELGNENGTVKARFPKEGSYKVEMFGKDLSSSSEAVPLVANFFVECTQPLKDATPFPKVVGAKWGPGCRLHEPTSGTLSRDQVVNIKVDVPDAVKVAVKGDSVQLMNKVEGNTWEAKYAIGKAEKSVAVLVNFEEGSQKFAGLLEFAVEDLLSERVPKYRTLRVLLRSSSPGQANNMGCGASTTAAPSGTTIGTQTDRSFVARQKDKEAIEASSGAAKLPRRQLRPLGRGPDLNAIEADARKTLQPANVLPSIKHKDGTTQKNPVLPLYHPPLPQIPSGPSQEATGSQGKSVIANGTETLIVIPDETFDSSDDDLSSLDDNNPDDGYGYGNGTEKVGIASIVGTKAANQQNGGKGSKGNSTNVSPTKMFSLGATDTVITSDELIRNSKADQNATATNGTAVNDAGAAGQAGESPTTTQNASQQVNAPSENGPVPDRSDNATSNPPEDNTPVQENNNNPSPKGPVSLLLQNGNGDTLKKIHVGDNFSVAVNIVLQTMDPTAVLPNKPVDASLNNVAEQNGAFSENGVSLAQNVVKVVNNDQQVAAANATGEQNITVAEKNLLELTGNEECTDTVDKTTNATTNDNANVSGSDSVGAKQGLPEVIVTDHEEDSEEQIQEETTEQTLEKEKTADLSVSGKQRRMLQLLRDFDLKKKLEERSRNRAEELDSKADGRSSNGDVKEQNLSNETIEGKIPEPNVPHRKKAAVLGTEETSLFKHIEVHAVYHALEPPKPADTFSTLVKTLLIHDLSDLEKVRMLFHWITAQNLQDMTFGDDVVEDSPLGYLKAIKEGKGNCAKLFEQLCCAAGLKCHVIKGYKKGDDCLPDHNFQEHRKDHRGTWNAVLVDGEWRLIDCHWAARGVRAIEENGGPIENVNDVYKFEEFYFLTDPEDLIDTHFPDCPEWQLLEKYLTITQFQSRVKRWPMFHQLGLKLKSHRAVVVITAGDCVELCLGFSKEKRKDFRIVYQLKTREGGSEVDGVNLNRYVLQETWDSNENFTVDVPKSGAYVLDIYGKPCAEVSGKDVKVCQYMIVCDTEKHTSMPFPEHTSTWGPGKVLVSSGIFPVSHARAVVRSQGQVVLTFQSNRHLEFRHRLYMQAFDEKGLEDLVVHSIVNNKISFYVRTPTKGKYGLIIFAKDPNDGTLRPVYSYVIICDKEPKGITPFPLVQDGQFGTRQPYFSELGLIENDNPSYFLASENNGEVEVQLENPDQKQIMSSLSIRTDNGTEKCDRYTLTQALGEKTVILVHLPQVGEYALQLFARDSQGQKRNVVNYCISCNAAKEDCKPFPCHNDNTWGPVYPTFSNLGLALDVPQRPYLMSRSGKYNVSLGMTQPLMLRHHFFHCADETRENMDDFAFCETIKHKATITTCFPKAGDYCLEIYGTTFPPSDNDLPLVATFFMRCLHPLETGCKTFPQIIGRMWGPGCCLYEPLAGVLSRDREVAFRVDVPDADDVVLKSADSVTDMSKDQSGTWTCSYTPSKTETSLLLLGKFDKNVNRYVGLLEFKLDN
ncbi:uncharacterized protein LOC144907475 [Branchiostoma floridae x Branchiostoma belcheri]